MTRLQSFALSSALVFLTACASSTAMKQEVFDCSPGQDLEIRAGLGDPQSGERFGYVFLVEVANNSNEELTVERVRVDTRQSEGSSRQGAAPQGGGKTYDQTIAPGTEHVFELASTAPATMTPGLWNVVVPGEFELLATVKLTNGETYRCSFLVGGGR